MIAFSMVTLSLNSLPKRCFLAASIFEYTDSKFRHEYPPPVFSFFRKQSSVQQGFIIARAIDSWEIYSADSNSLNDLDSLTSNPAILVLLFVVPDVVRSNCWASSLTVLAAVAIIICCLVPWKSTEGFPFPSFNAAEEMLLFDDDDKLESESSSLLLSTTSSFCSWKNASSSNNSSPSSFSSTSSGRSSSLLL